MDEDEEEGTSIQGFGADSDRVDPTKATKRLSQLSEDELSIVTANEDVPVSLTTMEPTKKKKPATMDNERRLSSIKINEVLQEVLDSQAQHHDDAELSEQLARGDSLDKEDTQRRADIQELLAEGSNSQCKANAATKLTNWKMKSEEKNEVGQTKSKASEKMKVP